MSASCNPDTRPPSVVYNSGDVTAKERSAEEKRTKIDETLSRRVRISCLLL